tara:strand:- start:436 stop:1227 length:792 start_codon:yes stop_codon:yes gene_type:complete
MIPSYLNRKGIHWTVYLGETVGLPNVCDMDCPTCVDDYGALNINLSVQDLRNKRASNWKFPEDWEFKEEWKFAVKRFFSKRNETIRSFVFTGRGDPLFYIPVIKAYMEVYKDLGIKGHGVINTSGSLLTRSMISSLKDFGINEIIINPLASNFNSYDKMSLVKEDMEVSVEAPLLYHCRDNLFSMLPIIEDIGVKHLILPFAEIYSINGINKMHNYTGEHPEIIKQNGLSFVDDKGVGEEIRKEVFKKGYSYSVHITKADTLI